MTKKRVFLIIFSWFIVLAIMITIFIFSSQNGKTSSNTSGGIIKKVLSIFMDDNKITPELIKSFQYPIRKLAHFSVYLFLGFALANAYNVTIKKLKLILNFCFSVTSALLYAISDEIHQGFVGGRAPMVTDVIVDTVGAICGVALFDLIVHLYRKKLAKKNFHYGT